MLANPTGISARMAKGIEAIDRLEVQEEGLYRATAVAYPTVTVTGRDERPCEWWWRKNVSSVFRLGATP